MLNIPEATLPNEGWFITLPQSSKGKSGIIFQTISLNPQ